MTTEKHTAVDAPDNIVRIKIYSMLEIPTAYQKALDEWDDRNGDTWDAKIELQQINFENNFRRRTYECVFRITVGSYLYGE